MELSSVGRWKKHSY